MNENYSEIAKMINRAKSVAVYCHTNPDGDTLGCALALYSALVKKGKSADVFCEDAVPDKYKGLPFAEKVGFPNKNAHDLAIAVDCSDIDRLGSAVKSFLSAKEQIALDHHRSHKRFADRIIVDENASACAEIVYGLLKNMRLIDSVCAELLFGAIVTDSGCFSFSNTSVHTHKIAAELLEYGIDGGRIIYELNRKTPIEVFALKNRVLSKCKFFADGRIGIIIFKREDFEATGTKPTDTEGIISSVIDIDGVEIAFAVSEAAEKSFKISIRSKGTADASACAAVFGGGGHKNAAGCRLNGYLEDVVDKLVKAGKDSLI